MPPAYWPCLFDWGGHAPPTGLLVRMAAAVGERDRRGMLVPIGPAAQVLLFPEQALTDRGLAGFRDAVAAVLHAARATGAPRELRTVLGQRIGPDEPLLAVAARLRRLERHAEARGEDPAWAPRHSLGCLLEALDARGARPLALGELARLIEYDREHGTQLAEVLELALDHGNRSAAADAAFMHRNTFRRHLRRALTLVDADLDLPEERLAVHLALKLLHRSRPAREPEPGPR